MTRILDKNHFAVRPSGEPRESHELAELLGRRFSCRGYLPTPVPRATIESFLSIAQLTASWCNSQAWLAHITSGGRHGASPTLS